MRKVKQTKKQINIDHDTVSPYDFEGKLSDVISMLQRLEQFYPDSHMRYGQHIEYSDSYSFMIYSQREETDEEYKQRVALMEETNKRYIDNAKKMLDSLGYDIVKKK